MGRHVKVASCMRLISAASRSPPCYICKGRAGATTRSSIQLITGHAPPDLPPLTQTAPPPRPFVPHPRSPDLRPTNYPQTLPCILTHPPFPHVQRLLGPTVPRAEPKDLYRRSILDKCCSHPRPLGPGSHRPRRRTGQRECIHTTNVESVTASKKGISLDSDRSDAAGSL